MKLKQYQFVITEWHKVLTVAVLLQKYDSSLIAVYYITHHYSASNTQLCFQFLYTIEVMKAELVIKVIIETLSALERVFNYYLVMKVIFNDKKFNISLELVCSITFR